MFNKEQSLLVATSIVTKIATQFNVPIEMRHTENNSYLIKLNNGFIADASNDHNPYVLTANNLSKVINDDFYRTRNDGNYFSQPVNGEFEIGIQ